MAVKWTQSMVRAPGMVLTHSIGHVPPVDKAVLDMEVQVLSIGRTSTVSFFCFFAPPLFAAGVRRRVAKILVFQMEFFENYVFLG